MNASQRRITRRAISAATGIVAGLRMIREGYAKPVTVLQVSPGGRRNALVKRGDNHRVVMPLADLQALPA